MSIKALATALKHLPGKHSQQTHGHGDGGGATSSNAQTTGSFSDTKVIGTRPSGKPATTKQRGVKSMANALKKNAIVSVTAARENGEHHVRILTWAYGGGNRYNVKAQQRLDSNIAKGQKGWDTAFEKDASTPEAAAQLAHDFLYK